MPAPVIFTSGPTRLRSVVVRLTLRRSWNEAESCAEVGGLLPRPPAIPTACLAVSERIICATLRPRIAPSWNTANTGAAEVRHDGALAVAGGAHADLRLHLAVELVEIGHALQQRQRAHADEIAAAARRRRIAGRRIDR